MKPFLQLVAGLPVGAMKLTFLYSGALHCIACKSLFLASERRKSSEARQVYLAYLVRRGTRLFQRFYVFSASY